MIATQVCCKTSIIGSWSSLGVNYVLVPSLSRFSSVYFYFTLPALTSGFISARKSIFLYLCMNYRISHISCQGILLSPLGILTACAVQLAMATSKVHAKTVLSQCLLCPQITASVTVATPFSKKNSPIRCRPSVFIIGLKA